MKIENLLSYNLKFRLKHLVAPITTFTPSYFVEMVLLQSTYYTKWPVTLVSGGLGDDAIFVRVLTRILKIAVKCCCPEKVGVLPTPIHESSAFQMFIFHIYMLLFMFLLFLGTRTLIRILPFSFREDRKNLLRCTFLIN